MLRVCRAWISGMLALACLALVPACRKPAEAVKSELAEAGYRLEPADWFRAARADDTTALAAFLKAGFDLDARDDQGAHALHAAAAAGAAGAAKFLLDRGIEVNRPGAGGRTPLMAAVLGDQPVMVRWLLRQGADPRARDADDFSALMLAVREDRPAVIPELAGAGGENLDPALLLAAILGRTEVIDALTGFGGSVYARMDDGRTPLMLAAQNGHTDTVEFLLDIGASRHATDHEGDRAADLALAASHPEIAGLILRDPQPGEFALEEPASLAAAMADLPAPARPNEGNPEPVSIDGQTLSAALLPAGGDDPDESAAHPAGPPDSVAGPLAAAAPPARSVPAGGPFPMPPLVMRHYRERELPVRVREVEGETAIVEILGTERREVRLRPGETVPGSRIVVVSARRMWVDSKLDDGQETEVAVLEVRDESTGATGQWVAGLPAAAHDPVAVVEDAATGRRYLATPGRRFTSADGAEFIISDVRPNQILVEDAASGAVTTLPLRGPRG